MRLITLLLLLTLAKLQPVVADESVDFDELPQAVGKDWMSMHRWSFTPPALQAFHGPDRLAYAHVGNDESGLLIYGEDQLWGFWDAGYLQWMRSDIGDIVKVLSLPRQQTLLSIRISWVDESSNTTRRKTGVRIIDSAGDDVSGFEIPGHAEVVTRADQIYSFTSDGTLSAHDFNGVELWSVATNNGYPEDGRQHLAITPGGVLAIVGQVVAGGEHTRNELLTYSLAGQELWRQPTGKGIDPAILLAADQIFVDHTDYRSYALRSMSKPVQRNPTAAPSLLYSTGLWRDDSQKANELVVFSADGKSKWGFGTDLGNYLATGLLKGGGVMLLPIASADYVGSWYSGTAFAFDVAGTMLWEVPVTNRGAAFARQCADGRLYVVTRSFAGMRDPESKPAEAQLHRLWQDGKWEDLYTFPAGYSPVAIDSMAKVYPGSGQLAVMLEMEGDSKPNTYGVITFEVWDTTLRQQPQG